MGFFKRKPKCDPKAVLAGIKDPDKQMAEAVKLLNESSRLNDRVVKILREVKEVHA